ncbi:response regulator (plasmid) [Deinococcus taeanensis]|uniref:response regulator transcription factor n=1 Tax=Deinococcus taeanensis TaxID=2737050 RepID=UPI001CDD3254|nr:response regulator [Deinococcus taeanensis]UBV45470.1 response regulator [Deinococcus taeanensis]
MTTPTMIPTAPLRDTAPILLVEDGGAMRSLQRFLLRREGWPLIECDDLGDARTVLAATTPALVVLDVNLPSGSGLELLPLIDRSRTRVLVMSAATAQADLAPGVADAFLAKPFELGAFTALIEQLTH